MFPLPFVCHPLGVAGPFRYKEMEKVCSSEGIDISQTSYTVPDTVPKLASYYNCQFIVYSDRVDGNITFQTHNPIRDSLPIVLLYQQSDSHTAEYDSDGNTCLLYTSPSPRDKRQSRMPSSA